MMISTSANTIPVRVTANRTLSWNRFRLASSPIFAFQQAPLNLDTYPLTESNDTHSLNGVNFGSKFFCLLRSCQKSVRPAHNKSLIMPSPMQAPAPSCQSSPVLVLAFQPTG